MKMRHLFLFLWLPALAFGQQPYYGTVASGISLSPDADPADLQRITIRPGDVIQDENVRPSIQALFDTGRYRSIVVDATPAGNGTHLTFRATPHYFFSTFILEPEKLLGRPLSTLLRLPVGEKFSESRVQEIVTQTQQILEEAGYFNVTLTKAYGPDNDFRLRSVVLTAIAGPRARIGEVVIEGGEGMLPAEDLRDALDVSTGFPYIAGNVDKGRTAIQKKFVDENFLNTRVDWKPTYNPATNTVRVNVTISPGQKTVIEINEAGRALISNEDLRDLVPIFEEGLFDRDLIREGRANIIEFLQRKGYFEAEVEEPQVIPATASEPTRILVNVDPGERHTVRSIRFTGNTVFKDKVLKDRLRIREAGTFSFLNRGLFSEELVEDDISTIQNMYRSLGYEAAIVEYNRADTPDHKIDVVFNIIENVRYPIERLVFTGNEILQETELRAAIKLKEGDFYSPLEAEAAQAALIRYYYSMGFPDVRVEVAADRDAASGNKLLTYRITEGPRYRIGEILVSGNTHTADKVIRRTSELKEYKDWFDPEKVLTGQQKLYGTGLFSHVEIVPLDRETGETRPVLIQVEESKHIQVTPGVGVKEYAGPRVTLDVAHNNMFGLNQALGVRIRVGVHEQQFQTTYRQPRLLNRDKLEGFGTLTIDQRNQKFFKASGVEFSLQVRKEISNTRSFLTTASYQTVNLQSIKLSPVVRANPDVEGVIQIARLASSFISDSRDDLLDPRRGVFSTSTFQIASRAWGSEVNFLSFFNQNNFHRPSGRATLAFSERIGLKIPYGQTAELPITERYFAGGSTSLRGFGLDEAGPPGGGQLLTIGNVEYRAPFANLALWDLGLGGAFFYDTGTVFERPSDFSLKDFTHSAGAGLRVQTPLGPVRFDVGVNLFPRTKLDSAGVPVREGRVHMFFTLGHTF
jgi:outer membrane protein assembly complex protein YaeT